MSDGELAEELKRREQLLARLSDLESSNTVLRDNLNTITSSVKSSGNNQYGSNAARQHVGSMLDACSFMCLSNSTLRAALASLLYQQERVVAYLCQLSENDKTEIMKLVRERFADQDLLESIGDNVEPEAPFCTVDPTNLAKEWVALLGPDFATGALSPTNDEHAESSKAANGELNQEAVDFIVRALEANRQLYVRAMANSGGVGSEDAKENFGFSMHTLPGYEYEFDEEDTEHNIVRQDTPVGGDSSISIKCATINKLVERMTTEDTNLRYTFLLTYRSFITSREFLEKLESRYNIPIPPNMTPEEMKLFITCKVAPVQIKVFAVLKAWVEDYFDDFEDDVELREQLKLVVNNMIEKNYGPWSVKSGKALLKLIERKVDGVEQVLVPNMDDVPKPRIDPNVTFASFNLLETKPVEIARQLTLVDWETFGAIKSREFLNQSWSKSHKHISAPHVVSMIERFNKVCLWVQHEILACDQLQQRVSMMVYMLKIAKHCLLLNNYHSLYAIYTGLVANPIHRLRKTWAELENSKPLRRFQHLQDLFNPSKNMARFRKTLSSAITPCIPYVGLFLSDLTFIEDGNPSTLRGMVNFHKRRMLAERIQWIKQYQQQAYRFMKVEVILQWLDSRMQFVADNEEDVLWNLSLKVEPRGE